MKNYFTVILIIFFLSAIGCAETTKNIQTESQSSIKTQVAQKPQLYTAYNIWRMKPHNMKCINYKYGNDILPAGTKVRNVGIKWDRQFNKNMIRFRKVEDKRFYNIYFTKNWHPGKSVKDYKDLMITTKTFEELTAGMSEDEINAIKNGMIRNGMSKKAVLVSYGYPPEHRTITLNSNVWIYWRNKFTTFRICFDKDERTTYCR